MKKDSWYSVRYVGEDGYFHDDQIRGLKEAKRLAKHYGVSYQLIK
jgi:hypothetical protein